MVRSPDIQGILFDSGDTLMTPSSGEWLPGPAFRRMVAQRPDLTLDWNLLEQAHADALAHLLEDHHLQSEDEERERFQNYFAWLLRGLGAQEPLERLAEEIARETVEHPSIELFPDVVSALERFAADGLKLGVISNGWPSLDRQLQLLGVRDFFDVLIISARVGSRKPDERIFQVALTGMGLPPENVLLVDDALENIVAAERLGMQGVVIARDEAWPSADADFSRIISLSDLDVSS